MTLLSMLLISRFMDFWKMTCISSLCFVIICRLHLFRSSASSFSSNNFYFSNHQGAGFFFFFFLLLSLPSFFLQWHFEEDNFFLEYFQPNWRFYAGYCLEASSSLLCIQSFPNTFVPIFLVSTSLDHNVQCSKHNT